MASGGIGNVNLHGDIEFIQTSAAKPSKFGNPADFGIPFTGVSLSWSFPVEYLLIYFIVAGHPQSAPPRRGRRQYQLQQFTVAQRLTRHPRLSDIYTRWWNQNGNLHRSTYHGADPSVILGMDIHTQSAHQRQGQIARSPDRGVRDLQEQGQPFKMARQKPSPSTDLLRNVPRWCRRFQRRLSRYHGVPA